MIDKEKIIENLKFIFEPLQIDKIEFRESNDIYTSLHKIGTPINMFDTKNKITFYPITLKTKYGDLDITLRSEDLDDIKNAIGNAYMNPKFSHKVKIPDEILIAIQKRIYMP
jgi:hypothetical protein